MPSLSCLNDAFSEEEGNPEAAAAADKIGVKGFLFSLLLVVEDMITFGIGFHKQEVTEGFASIPSSTFSSLLEPGTVLAST